MMCSIAIAIIIYLVVDLQISGTLNYKLIFTFVLFVFLTVWGIWDYTRQFARMKQQEEEIKMYQLYIQPLEALVKEIRAKQHEFDNHINAIHNMHYMIDDYEELVKSQSEYMKDIVSHEEREYLPLLKISDKVLAGFLYSKLVSAPENVKTKLQVQKLELISRVSISYLVEIIGTLVDNAYEACDEKYCHVYIYIDSEEDRLIFEVQNEYPSLKFGEFEKFFEQGYSTKAKDGSRGNGLYQAKKLTEKLGGELTVGEVKIDNENYISFKVML